MYRLHSGGIIIEHKYVLLGFSQQRLNLGDEVMSLLNRQAGKQRRPFDGFDIFGYMQVSPQIGRNRIP